MRYLLSLLLFLSLTASGQLYQSGNPTQSVDDAGFGQYAWSGNFNDGFYSANCTISTESSTYTHRLILTHTDIAIPAGAIIKGVEVTTYVQAFQFGHITENCSDICCYSYTVALTSPGFLTYKTGVGFIPGDYTEQIYGGPTDLWSISMNHNDINSDDFGIYFIAQTKSYQGFNASVRLWGATIKVYYELPKTNIFFGR